MLGRVAYVVNVFPKLSETFIAWELAELRRRGVEVCILSLRPPDEGRRHAFFQAGLPNDLVAPPCVHRTKGGATRSLGRPAWKNA